MSTLLSPSPRVSCWEWGQVVLVLLNLAWTTLGFGGYLPETMVATTALVALALAVHGLRRTCSSEPMAARHPAGLLLLPFLLYAAANVWWVTPVPWLGWQDWLGWAHLTAIFWIVLNDLRSRAAQRMVCGVILTIAVGSVGLACYQRFVQLNWLPFGRTQAAQFLERSSGPFFVPNSFAALLVLVLPATLYPVFARGVGAVVRVGFGYLAGLLLLGLGLTISRGAWLGLAVAVVVWPLCTGGRSWRRRLMLALGVVVALATVATTLYVAVPKVRERLDYLARDAGEKSRPVLWRAAGKIFSAHPVVGAGAGSYNTSFEFHRPEQEQKHPEWAHSDYLNTLADYGLVGFGLFFGVAGFIAVRCARWKPPAAPAVPAWDWFESPGFSLALAVGLGAFALHLAVDFHLKIPALALTAATVAGLVVRRAWPSGAAVAGSARGRILGAGVAVAAISFAAGGSVPLYRAEAKRDAARRTLDGLLVSPALPLAQKIALVEDARAAFAQALALDPRNSQTWSDRAYAAAILGYLEPAREKEFGQLAEGDARRAVAQAPAGAEFWQRLGVALDMQRRWPEADQAMGEALRLAPVSASVWFYYAYHLSLNPVTEPRARAAVAISLRLDPSAPEAESLRQSLAARR